MGTTNSPSSDDMWILRRHTSTGSRCNFGWLLHDGVFGVRLQAELCVLHIIVIVIMFSHPSILFIYPEPNVYLTLLLTI